ncbi:MAG: NAD(P)H-dependent oxidoreductase [Acidobacteria bacterium]|nr:NAD(P)H-dependent oxidoreductase [Acidobacteriota bacterium]
MNKGLISNAELIEQLKWRYAVKVFDREKKISDEDWQALEDTLVLAPSSYGLQPWKYYVISDPETRQKLLPCSFHQKQTVDCSHLVVIAARKDTCPNDIEKYIERIIEVRGTPPEELEAMKNVMIGMRKAAADAGVINEWAARQCFISLGFLMTAAAIRGIDTCPMEGFVPEEYDRILNIAEDGYFSVVVCALGYRHEERDWLGKLPKVRFEKEDVIKQI